MSNNFDLTNLALQAICPGNELIYDDKGMPSIMVKIPKQTYAQLGLGSSNEVFPAFIVNGVEKDAIWISKYQNIVQNDRAYSLPGEDPRTSINFDTALQVCKNKGAGWHCITNMEWALLALWCKHNGTMPKGNNNYGKDSSETAYKAIPSMARDAEGRIQRVATGTGPVTWSHDGTPAGIWDLNGNVYEWNGGIRTVYGELQVLADNNAADNTKSQAANSTEWKAIDATTGALITPNGSGTTANSVKMDWVSNHCRYSTSIATKADAGRGCSFESVDCDSTIGDTAKLVLQAMAMLKYDTASGAYASDYFYFNNGVAERSFSSGGSWNSGGYAGVFFRYGYYTRTTSSAHIGFRSAYYET